MTFDPDWASPPGDTIVDLLDIRGMSIADLVDQTGSSVEVIHNLVQGRGTVTIALARTLERVLGSSREFWVSRDYQYRQQMARLRGTADDWIRQIPISQMVRFGWLQPAPSPSEEVQACLRYFGVSSVQAWHDKYSSVMKAVSFRKSRTFDSWPAATAAWLRQGEIEARRVDCAPWNPNGFRNCLKEIRNLTRIKQPSCFLPDLQALSAAHGVAVTVVRAPAGCRASGATRFLSREKALLLLSFRYLSDDHFWFSFFHEAGHLLLHGGNKWVLEGTELMMDEMERQANEFAEKELIPSALRDEFWALRAESRDVIRFARRAGISPGIVVGQLQHHGRVTHSQLNTLKRRYSWRRKK